MKDIRIAAVIFHSPVGRTKYNLYRMEKWIKAAANKGAAIICFPELNITGYCTQENIRNNAERVPGMITQHLVKFASHYKIVILAGLAEKDSQNRLYATHAVIKPDGAADTYRKVHLAPPEQDLFSPGTRAPLFDACGIKVGIQLCYDAHFPELSTCMAVNGADVVFFPHASPRGTPDEKYRSWTRHLPARAFDNSIFVVACNQSGDNQQGLDFPGIAMVIGPSGDILKKNVDGSESMLIADLKADELNRVREHRMRYFLPNRRPDLYHNFE